MAAAMEEKKTDKQTVFVRGVSFDVGDQEFNDFFSDIGPVRQAFLVKSKGATKHKGFGFVHFALQSDAERAAAELNGKELGGRKLQVEVALKRAPLEERKKKRKQQQEGVDGEGPAEAEPAPDDEQPQQNEPPTKKAKPVKPAPAPGAAAGKQGGAEKHRMLRAVAVGRLTPETLSAAIKMAQAAGEVEEVVSPVPQSVVDQYKLERDGCSGHAFVAVYSSVKQAMAAVAQLHGQPVAQPTGLGPGGEKKKKKQKGKQGRAAEQQQQQEAGGGSGATVLLWARQVSGEGLHLKRWRLIVRNLPFSVSEQDLRGAFAPAGFLWELTLPRSPDGKARGFAFVGYTCRVHAEQGIRLVNGQQVAGRPVAVDWALSKAQFDAAAKQPHGGAGVPAKDSKDAGGLAVLDSDSDEGEVPGGKKAAAGRKALGHESDEEGAEVAPEQERSMLHSVIDNILGAGKAGHAKQTGVGLDKEEARGEGVSDSELGLEGEESEEEEEEERKDGEQGRGGAAGGDMFSKQALQERSGAQRAALERLERKAPAKPPAKAAEQGQHKGGEGGEPARQPREAVEGATVFIRGLALDVTKQQLQSKMQAFGRVASCRLVVDKASGRLKGTAFVDFAEPQAAHKAAEACAKARRKEGAGVVVAGRMVDVDLALGQEAVRSLAVQQAGERGPRDKRNLYLAKEGVIAEGSPAWEEMSQQDRNKRKRAAVEKKTKLASPNFQMSATRLSVRNIPLSWTEKQLKQLFVEAVVERASKAQPRVRQVKILVDEEGAGARGGGGPRSKGIGFVQFEDHEHALCALRQLNNNPKPWGKERRPIVEFAIENAKILKAREAKLSRAKQQQQQAQQTDGPEAEQQQHGPPAKRAKAERGGTQQKGGEAAGLSGQQQAQQDEDGGGGAQDGMQPQPQQQSKRQRRREIKLKLRAVKQQKIQEAAAAAAAAREQQGANGASAQPSPGSDAAGHSRAKKRRELRKAKKQGGAGTAAAAVAAAGATVQPVAPKQQPQLQQPKAQQLDKAKGGKPWQKQQQQQGQQQRGEQPQQQQRARQQGGQGKGTANQGKQPPQQAGQGKGAGQQPPRSPTAAGVNSRAGKGKQQAQREQQAQQRKRRADEALNSLVGGMAGALQQKKPRQKGEKADHLDKLAAEYRAKFFGGGKKAGPGEAGGKGGAQRPAGVQLGLKRWFE